jgi:aminoglycoside phosphotransferase (APT) family kinase protein
VEKRDITAAVAAGLIAEQFPQWADLAVVPVACDGWDNTTFRLGDELSMRLPSADSYAAQVEKEQRWLPVLARHLPMRIPEPVALGAPGCGFPSPWSIYRWIDGEPASLDRIADMAEFASVLADFLCALHDIDATGGPAPGDHNFFRGGRLDTYDVEARGAIAQLTDWVDRNAVTEVWEAALASEWDRSPVWVHGDVAPSNLLVVNGHLQAVIDFGSVGVGDPACDLVMAWTFLTDEGTAMFRDRLGVDDATWERGRGWALWKALITLPPERPAAHNAGAPRSGQRSGPRAVIDRILADHYSS